MTKPRKLTQKQQLFVEAIVGEAAGNATEAARRAGYKGTTTALTVVACRNLGKASIVNAIAQLRADLEEDSKHLNPNRFHGLLRKFADDDELPVRERLHALDLYGKAAGMFREIREHVGPGGGPVQVAAVDMRSYLEQYRDSELTELEADLSLGLESEPED